MTPARCAEPDCIRPVWRDGLCWWCYQQAASRIRLDSPSDSNPSLGPMMGDDDP
jgi:hypothetical protein